MIRIARISRQVGLSVAICLFPALAQAGDWTSHYFEVKKPSLSGGFLKTVDGAVSGQVTFANFEAYGLTRSTVDPVTQKAVESPVFSTGLSLGVSPLGGADATTSLGIPVGGYLQQMGLLSEHGGYLVRQSQTDTASPWFIAVTLDLARTAEIGWRAVTGAP